MDSDIFFKLSCLLLLLNLGVRAQENSFREWVDAPEAELVISQCTGCHSSQLILTQRLSKQGWLATIRWMQEEHGLWPLEDFEDPIVRYLAKYYGPDGEANGRRRPIKP